ncbi:MAG: arsenical pump-driving ATPase, partial [Sutterella sp.]|nr:arsenical pump-driving ATPase [Sutterella sp.]
VQNRADLAPDSELERQSHHYHAAIQSLINPTKTRFVTVCRPHAASVREAARTVDELRDSGVVNQTLVLNGVLPESESGTGPLATSIFEWESDVIKNLPAPLPALPRDILPLKPDTLVGAANLRTLLRDDGEPVEDVEFDPPAPKPLADLVNEIAASGHGLIMMLGKGGVGKTSVAAASAVALAGLGKRVLLVSTDPASNVSQVFGQPIGNQVTGIQSVPGLSAIEIDPQAAAAYREKLIQPIRGLLPDETVASITEQLSGACTTEIAAFDEFTGLLTDPEVTSQYDHILFDTAPTGHTIRLLELPGAWSQYLDANPNGTSCLGPVSGLDKQRSQYAAAVRSLSDPAETRLVLVARAHRASIREAARTSEELAGIGIKNQYLVLNGVMPATDSASGELAQSVCLRERKAISEIPEPLKSLPRDTLFLKPRNMVGVEALRTLFIKNSESKAENTAFTPPEPKPLSDLIAGLTGMGHGLIMLMGKGGVGKTTMAAAIAARLAKMGYDVHLSTSDPAAHVDAALAGSVPGLTVSRIDPVKETENYRALVLKTQGAGLDDAGKKLLEEDLRSPCTEEIAVFQAFSRVIREADKRFVVMDTAPTGHTLLLLDAAGAYHREVVRKMGETGSDTTPLSLLQNPDMTRVIIVTLPETTPVLEAKGLEADLRRAGITPWGYIVNDSLAAADPESPLLRKRAASELPLIREIESESPRTAIVPLQTDEPVGVEKLLALTR